MKYKHFKQALLFKVDSFIIFFSVAMELNQSILYTPLILKASIILSSKRSVAEILMSGMLIFLSSALYLLVAISKESQLHLKMKCILPRTFISSIFIDILPPTAMNTTGFPSFPYSLLPKIRNYHPIHD